jgi:hypothetical protein
MKNRSDTKKTGSFKSAIKGAAGAARKKAFKNNLPVAISKDGGVFLLYADNSLEKATSKRIAELIP